MRAFTTTALALASGAAATSVSTTPHDSYSSSVGVLGCKINTDRVAYWPGSVDCNNFCIKLSHEGRSVHLLRIDQSGGAHDISYDAWAYLQTGKPASANPIAGGGVAMEYEEVDPSECADLIYTDGHKLPLSASNSMNFLTSCLAQPNSYVAKNHVLYNICDAICTLGHDEVCHLDLSVSNQASCGHTLGLTDPLKTAPVYNVLYQSGKTVVAGSGEEVSPKAKTEPETSNDEEPAPAVAPVPTSAGAVFQEQPKPTSEAPVPVEYPASSSVAAPVPVSSTSEYPVVASSTSSNEAQPTIPSSTPLAPYPTAGPSSSYGNYNTTLSPVPSSKPAGGVGYTTLVKTTSVNRTPTAPSNAPTGSVVNSGAWRIAGASSLVFSIAGMVVFSALF